MRRRREASCRSRSRVAPRRDSARVDSLNDPREQQANQFAANYLIPPARAGQLANLRSSADVQAFARSVGIAPGIVVGRLQHDGIIGFNQLNGLKTWLEWTDNA